MKTMEYCVSFMAVSAGVMSLVVAAVMIRDTWFQRRRL